MNPDRFQSFAEAYAPAVLRAVVDLGLHLNGKTPQQFALDATLDLLAMIQAGDGIISVSHYIINTRGGALRHTCDSLGIMSTARAIEDYLDGGDLHGNPN